MQREELPLSDQQIIYYIKQNWNFNITKISYISTGSTFAFCLVKQDGEKVFLKIIQKNFSDFLAFQSSLYFYKDIIASFVELEKYYDLPYIPKIIFTKDLECLYESGEDIFVLYEFIEGDHPTDQKDIDANKLASVFGSLHHLPINYFSFLPKEEFDIEYALGIEKLLAFIDDIDSEPMRKKIIAHHKQLRRALDIIIMLRKKFEAIEFKYFLTHGDAHHYNILQTHNELFLIDWQNPKLAPIERDLWHHMDYPIIIEEYHKLNISFTINHELCIFYKIQRFLEDIRFYLEQVAISKEQKIENNDDFLNHWGWKLNVNI